MFRGFSLSGGPHKGMTPLIINSHTNETGREALEKDWGLLMEGKSALDTVEKAANVIEVDPECTGFLDFCPTRPALCQVLAMVPV